MAATPKIFFVCKLFCQLSQIIKFWATLFEVISNEALKLEANYCVQPSRTCILDRFKIHLFVSYDGSIISAAEVDHIADARERMGCDVNRVCYEDTSHVDHFGQHCESYTNNIDCFVRKCIDAKNKQWWVVIDGLLKI